jgi:AraC-like DNA-binding protein
MEHYQNYGQSSRPDTAFFAADCRPRLNYLDQYTRGKVQHIRPRMLHQHEHDVELLFILEGDSLYRIGHRNHLVQAGDLLVCNSQIDHESNRAFFENISCYVLSLSQIQVPGLRPNSLIADNQDPILHFQDQYQLIRDIFELLMACIKSSPPNTERSVHYFVLGLLSVVLSQSGQPAGKTTANSRKNAQLAQKMIQHLDDHFCEELSIQDICQQFYVSVYYMSHLFKAEYGCSPMQYAIKRRLGLAQTLLETTEQSISLIASTVGYADANQFYALFSKHVGLSPTSYRDTFRVNDQTVGDHS